MSLQVPVSPLSEFRLNSSGLIDLYLNERKVTLLLLVEAKLMKIYLSWTHAFSFQVTPMLIHDLKKKKKKWGRVDTNLLPMSQFLTPSKFEDTEDHHTSPSQDFLPYSLRGYLLVDPSCNSLKCQLCSR